MSYIQVLLNNPDELNKFTFDLKDLFNQHGYYELNIYNSSDSYDTVAGSIESLSEISDMIIIVSSFVSIIILGLVTTIMIRNRKHEMGVYLSLGENKKNILLQIFLEVYLVGMLAISLSLVSGDYLGQKLSENIIIYQNEKQSEVIDEKFELLGAVVPEGLEINKITDEIETSLSVSYAITIYIVSTLVFIISILFPSVYILKLEPRKIML